MRTLYRITRERGRHQATAMDPKVLRKLLTHGHGGSKVDEYGSGDGIPLRQGAKIGLQIGSPWSKNLRWRKNHEKNGIDSFLNYEIYT